LVQVVTVTLHQMFANHWWANNWILLVNKGIGTAFVEAIPNIRDLVSGGSHIGCVSGGTLRTVTVTVAGDDEQIIVINN